MSHDMQNSVTVEVFIELPCAEVWARMRDLTRPHLYVPGILRTRVNTAALEGVGASRTVFPRRLPPLQETVTAWTEGRGLVLRLHRGEKAMSPFAAIEFVYDIEPAGPARTRFRPAMRYDTGTGLVGPLLDNAVLRRVLKANLRDIASNLKGFYETGKPTNPDFKGD
jgi:hypothetical protein